VFTLMSWRDARMASISQAGLVEKFVDALVWVFFPVYLHQRGLSLPGIGWVVGVYGFVWGMSQFFTGHLSDRIGRKKPIVWGMWLCGAGVALVLLGEGELWWSFAAAVMGFGMALLYPTLSAAVSDIAHPNWRGSAIGIYRFWRDLGYGIGALLLGAVAALFGGIEAGFWFTAAAMFVSGLIVLLRATKPIRASIRQRKLNEQNADRSLHQSCLAGSAWPCRRKPRRGRCPVRIHGLRRIRQQPDLAGADSCRRLEKGLHRRRARRCAVCK
jgi:MFS family permease